MLRSRVAKREDFQLHRRGFDYETMVRNGSNHKRRLVAVADSSGAASYDVAAKTPPVASAARPGNTGKGGIGR
jgi:hypothetical protein